MNNTVYSIIIPNLHSPVIGEVVSALKEQADVDGNFEIIVVGRDKYNLIETRGNVRFLESERDLSAAEARNRGIDMAVGAVIFFLDADCIPEKDWLSKLIDVIRDGYQVGGGSVTFKKDNFWTLCDNVSHFGLLHPSRKKGAAKDFNIHTANMFVDKQILLKVNKFDERYPGAGGEDFDLGMKIRKAGYVPFFEPAAVVVHKPERNSFKSFLKHTANWAPYSILLRIKYKDILGTPRILLFWPLLLLFSPLIALYITAKIFINHPPLLKYWYTMPVVYFDKLSWCILAAKELITKEVHKRFGVQ